MPEKTSRPAADDLVVAVTGPTGEIGIPFVNALERCDQVAEIRGMARRPFDTSSRGWTKTRYVQGDVLDRGAVDRLVEGADVVVHLAFIIFGSPDETRRVNLEGSRNVFQATVDAGATRLVYTSSVAAYGFHEDNDPPLREDDGPRGTETFYYSAQKAELEQTLQDIAGAAPVETYVFRPCIVAGPDSPALVTMVPYLGTPTFLPEPLRSLVNKLPGAGPVVPDPGLPLQLVHADDVATALVAGVLGEGPPGVYNLAGDGEITMSEVAAELGWRSVPVPDLALDVTAAMVSWLPKMPPEAAWIQTARIPVTMDTSRARHELSWSPSKDAKQTLRETMAGARQAGIVQPWGRSG